MFDSSESYQSGDMRKYKIQYTLGMLYDDIRLDRELDLIGEVCDELGTKLICYIEQLRSECHGMYQRASRVERREVELEGTVRVLAKRLDESDKENTGFLARANTLPFAIGFATAFLGSVTATYLLRR